MTCSTSWAKADHVHPFMDHHSVPIFRWLLPAQSVSQSSDLLKLVCWRQKRDWPIMSKVSLILTYLHVAIIHNVYYVAVVLCTGLPWQKRTTLLILLKQHCWKNTVETTPSTTLFFSTSLTLTWHLCFCILYISWMKQHVSPTA